MKENKCLEIKYHPAKKEIEFRKIIGNKSVKLSETSVLLKYMNQKKGKFVLQDYGNDFFNDIMTSFGGIQKVHVRMITTQIDYNDFEEMVDYYNLTEGKKTGNHITTELYKELPDMNKTFVKVKRNGENSSRILEEYKKILSERKINKAEACELCDNLVRILDEEISNINTITKELESTSVNLCFTGAYSSGKSTLINALLGVEILPEYIESKTAKMFIISSPSKKDEVSINFIANNKEISISWDDEKNVFVINALSETEIQHTLQKIINSNEKKLKHEQLLALLQKINDSESITSDIIMKYPIPLDNDKVSFTIYDTPGTDSNQVEHQNILKNALSEQKQSILIFVGKPDGLEGSANSILLEYLKEASSKAQTNIDISRSIFVINKADTVSKEARMSLQNSDIKKAKDDEFSIPLSDKKVLFISALYGRMAKEVKSNLRKEDDGGFEDGHYNLCTSSNKKLCYQQNKVGISQLSTKRLIEESDKVFENACKNNDRVSQVYVGSGLYALENEILKFGEKYASAVRAYAIINSIDKSLSRLASEVRIIKDENEKNAEEIIKDIENLEKTITSAIQIKYDTLKIDKDSPIPFKTLKKLGLDSDTIKTKVISPVKNEIKNLEDWMVKEKTKELNKKRIVDKVNERLSFFKENFKVNREFCLIEKRDEMMDHVKDTISKNGQISPEAKKVFMEIPAPNISGFQNEVKIESIYDDYISHEKFLFLWKKDVLDKAGFEENVENILLEKCTKKNDEFKEDYANSLNEILNKVSGTFTDRLKDYSITMNSLIKDKEETKALGELIEKAHDILQDSQKSFIDEIWGGNDDNV